MVWAPALVLMTAVSSVAPTRPLASTYDEAACPPIAAAADPVPADCSDPVVVVAPAIVDCNDPGMSPWVEEMIGSCDMPRPAPPNQGAPTVVRGTRGSATSRVCDGLHCSHDTTPLRSAPRSDDDGAQLLASTVALGWWPTVTAFVPANFDLRDQAHRAPPERPPRA
jgi:hypothetical protein